MLGTLLLFITATAQQSDDHTSFRLGPAAAVARRELVDGQVHLVVTVTNDTDGPLWWRGAGIGCIGFGMGKPPVDEDGRMRSGFGGSGVGCTMESDGEPTNEQLAEWRLDPGSSSTEVLRPFWQVEEWDEGLALRPEIPRLVRWIYEHEFTLPRATPPPGTMAFECPMVLFAWGRGLGLHAFVDGVDGDVSLPHFDPFDATPFYRDGPAPVHVGPLVGTMAVIGEDRPEVLLRLRNPGTVAVAWRPRRSAEPLRFAPGGEHLLRLSPFEDAADLAPAPGEEWQRVIGSSWPVLAVDAAAEAGPPAALHLVFDPRYGAGAGLTRREESFHAFRSSAVHTRASAAVRVGGAHLLAEVCRSAPSSLVIRLLPLGDECYWSDDFADQAATEQFRWVAEPPFGAPLPWHEPEPERPLLQSGDRMDWIRNRTRPGQLQSSFNVAPRAWDLPGLEEDEDRPAWEWRRVTLTPRAEPPTSTSGLEAVLLTVRWSQDTGLEMTVEPAPPLAR